MSKRFTEDDRDKFVVTSQGTRVGKVRDVNEDRAIIERDQGSDLAEDFLDWLGWGEESETEILGEHVNAVDEDEIRLHEPR